MFNWSGIPCSPCNMHILPVTEMDVVFDQDICNVKGKNMYGVLVCSKEISMVHKAYRHVDTQTNRQTYAIERHYIEPHNWKINLI